MLSSRVPIPAMRAGALGHEEMQPLEALMASRHTGARDGRRRSPPPASLHYITLSGAEVTWATWSEPCQEGAGGPQSPQGWKEEDRHMVTATDKGVEEQGT